MSNLTQRFATGDESSSGVTGMLKVNSVLQQRYMVSGVLGSGGMGAVYLARDMRFPNVVRNVAVKEVINTTGDPSAREQILKNFSREADVLAALSHPSIPKIYDYFASADRAYLVMEYIDGRDLEALVNQTPDFLPTEQVRRWAINLCDVLDYLHTHKPDPIIFRDVKPSNIMVDKQGEVRLIDFGIAKWFQRNQNQRGTMIGTEGYAPTEQYRGEPSPLSDIYALGATLHHILSKRDPRLEPPFTFNERPIRVINPTVSVEFDAVIMKALALDKSDRYQSAADMKAALVAAGRPVGNARYVPATTTDNNGPVNETEPVEEQDQIQLVWKFKVEDEIRSSPVHHNGIVYVGAYDNNLWGLDAKTGHLRLKYAAKDGIAGTPVISTEESLLLFGSEDQTIYALDLRTQKISWTFATDGPVRSSGIVAHGHLFIGSDDHFLYAVRLSSGRRDWRFDAGSPIRSRPAITDERIVFGTEDGEVFGLDLQSAIKWRFKTKRAVTSSPQVVDNIAYFGSMDGQVYAIDAASGWGIWRFRTAKSIVSSPLIVDKTLYIGSADGFMYALDLNGRELWKFKTNGQVVSSPRAHNGALYFGSTDHKVYCIDLKRGALRWEFLTEGPITSTACIVNDIVYIGSFDHQLYAFNA